ncbi:MAG TPA: DNA-formamidopyrimidine glycosylase family protein [Polyangiaceae bacterium]|nr:DNA-formamidopyrimidine glycosylase family protein [Polyangiaceae bacterium]
MPELPDVTVYVERLTALVGSSVLERVRLKSPFLLRSVAPPLAAVNGKVVRGVRRLGKRIVFELEGELFMVLHLMISGRLHWKKVGAPLTGRIGLAAFDFATGSLVLTEASTRKRASLYVVQGESELALHDRGGLEPIGSTYAQFKQQLLLENRTLKRALTAPHLFSGIGNAYSDEILHAAGLSPVTLTSRLSAADIKKLHRATQSTLKHWVATLRAESKDSFPEKVTAFRPDMAVHGKYKQPCPTCGTAVQRIRYAENEVNYCPRCQTEGRMLADRSLSRLLGSDWPKTVEDWEEEHPQRRDGTSS